MYKFAGVMYDVFMNLLLQIIMVALSLLGSDVDTDDVPCVMVAPHVDDATPADEALLDGAAYLTERDGAAHDDLGEWWEENGDGSFIGYSLTEDGSIWRTAECARAN